MRSPLLGHELVEPEFKARVTFPAAAPQSGSVAAAFLLAGTQGMCLLLSRPVLTWSSAEGWRGGGEEMNMEKAPNLSSQP